MKKRKRCDTATIKTQQRLNFSPILDLIYNLKISLSSTDNFFFKIIAFQKKIKSLLGLS